ncbi:amylovoran biosynthesis protein AmsE [Paenibacillus sp. PK3_47]|uniref:glycosyltransferase n=1 Tax=Paenibacillus sp. PK3_47 TaxID=2072642 RepID=UPI00201D99BC|nr:glycosyltransferase [Paenibacillus sp. PK3_47]UQZ33126.1 amylovoran biosynthesis protein AmsE [Paenibacillus sp. PK3_47]
MGDKKYSVLMSIYFKENPNYLRESIESMLQQTLKPDEIIIVKDGTLTPALEQVLNEFANEPCLKIIPLSENKGLGEALNIGMDYCKNEIIARMDTDDISKKDRCEKQFKLFEENELLSIVSSSIMEFEVDVDNVKAIKRLPLTHEQILKFAKKRNPFNHPAVMYKKSVVLQAGGYKHFELFEDYYLWARILMNNAIGANIDEPLLYMRANRNMYKRRGGISYFKCIIHFKWHLRKIGFYSFFDFLTSAFAQGAVAVLPNNIRMKIYKIFLRTDTKNNI